MSHLGLTGRMIYTNDNDREIYFEVLAEVVERFNWSIHAIA